MQDKVRAGGRKLTRTVASYLLCHTLSRSVRVVVRLDAAAQRCRREEGRLHQIPHGAPEHRPDRHQQGAEERLDLFSAVILFFLIFCEQGPGGHCSIIRTTNP